MARLEGVDGLGTSATAIHGRLRTRARPTEANATASAESLTRRVYVKGRGHGNWKGGRYVDNRGYVMVKDRSHPNANANGQVSEHRIVMEQHLGRLLKKHESVHHKNGVRTDNRIQNLELWTVPQPYGQRVSDLVDWVVSNYGDEVRKRLGVTA
jgi:hypothetical protein